MHGFGAQLRELAFSVVVGALGLGAAGAAVAFTAAAGVFTGGLAWAVAGGALIIGVLVAVACAGCAPFLRVLGAILTWARVDGVLAAAVACAYVLCWARGFSGGGGEAEGLCALSAPAFLTSAAWCWLYAVYLTQELLTQYGPSQFRGTPDCNESLYVHSYGVDAHCR